MVPTYVPVEAELLVRQALAAQSTTPALRPYPLTIARIELFVHALDAEKLVFATAEVNGVVTALSEPLLRMLQGIHSQHRAARRLRPYTRSTAKMPLMARTWATTRRS